MAGGESNEIPEFTGLKKYFNSYTVRGRINVVAATYGSIALAVLYFKFRPSKGKTEK